MLLKLSKSLALKISIIGIIFVTLASLGCRIGSNYSDNETFQSGPLGSISGKVLLSANKTEVSAAKVWIENLPNILPVISDTSGNYKFDNIPPGNHRIVAQKLISTITYKNRTAPVKFDGSTVNVTAPEIELTQATNIITGILKGPNGTPLPSTTKASLWGEVFNIGVGGTFVTPPLPDEVSISDIKISIPGSQETTNFIGTFIKGNTPAYIEQQILPVSANNRAPSAALISKNTAGEITVSCRANEKLFLSLETFDPDPDDAHNLAINWKTTNGEIEIYPDKKQAVWTAMAKPSIATVSATIEDPKGANSTINLRLLVDVLSMNDVDVKGPEILRQYPKPKSLDHELDTEVVVVFDEPLLTSSVKIDSIKVSSNNNLIHGTTEIQPNKRSIVWMPDTKLPHSSELNVKLSSSLRDSLGNPGNKEVNWQFSTKKIEDSTPALVTAPRLFRSISSDDKQITTFSFSNLTPTVFGVIDENAKKIVLIVPFGTDVTNLVPAINIAGLRISPNTGVAQNFTDPVIYTVTAMDGSTQDYEVSVTISNSLAKAITDFTVFDGYFDIKGKIDEATRKITINFAADINITSLSPVISYAGSSISPQSGVTQDFSNPIIYTVSASDGTTKTYEVIAEKSSNSQRNILAFDFKDFAPIVKGEIDKRNITLSVPAGTDLTSLTPTILHEGLFTIPNSNVPQDFSNTVKYTVYSGDWNTKVYKVNVYEAVNPDCAITQFNFNSFSPAVIGEVTPSSNQIKLTVPYGTNVTNLAPTITHTGISISPASGVSKNFSNPVTYTVTATDNSTQTYQVTVNIAKRTTKNIVTFDFEGLNPVVKGTVRTGAQTVTLSVPYGTNVTNLVPTITHNGASISPQSGVAQDFSNTVVYTVTAVNSGTKDFWVDVNIEPNNAKEITSFSFNGLSPAVSGLIDENGQVIYLTVPYGTNVANLVPTINHTGTSISPNSGAGTNFSSPVTYTVTAADYSTKEYNVIVTVAANSKKEITSFAFNGLSPAVNGTIDETNRKINLTVPYGTNITNLVPTYTHNGVSATPNSGVAKNFTNPVTYTITAEDTTQKSYQVIVTPELNPAKQITSFKFAGLNPVVNGVINESAKTISLTVPYGTNVSNLVPTIVHTGASISPGSGVARNFTNPVTYTVTAANSTTQNYQVTVDVEPNPSKAITSFVFNGLSPAINCNINESAKTISATVPYGTDVSALVPTIVHSGVSISPSSDIAQNFSSTVTYTVTAENTTTQNYQVNINVALNPAKSVSKITFKNSGAVAPLNVTINEPAGKIDVTVPKGTDVTALSLKIKHTGVSINPVSGSVQDFTNPVTYTVTAEDSSIKNYMVTVIKDNATTNYSSPNVGSLKVFEGNEFQRDDNPGNKTQVTSFRISKYEVTQAQYQAIMGYNPSWCVVPNVATNNLNRPVEKVTWFDAIEFCNKLSESEGLPLAYTITNRIPASGYPITDATVTLTGQNGYRLPTEAEWQWAFMGGQNARNKNFAGSNGSNDIDDYAWHYNNSVKGLIPSDEDYGTHPVGTKQPNELGLYDMSGNVAEWCWDFYDDYPSGATKDPTGATSGTYRIVRGGSWMSSIKHIKAGFRRYFFPGKKYDFYGIRVVRN